MKYTLNFLALFFLTFKLFALSTTCVQTGNWNSSSTWNNGIPTSTDEVIIPSGLIVTINVPSANCNSLLLSGQLYWNSFDTLYVGNAGIVFNDGAYISGASAGILKCTGDFSVSSSSNTTIEKSEFIIYGNTTINGQINFINNYGPKTFSNITINNGGYWNCTGNTNFTITGSFSNNGTFESGIPKYSFTGNGYSIGGSNTNVFSYLSIDDGGVITNTGTLSVLAKLFTNSGAGKLINAANKTLNILVTASNYALTTLDASANGNTVKYARSGNQLLVVPLNGIYHHLQFRGSGLKEIAGNLFINGNILISDSAEYYNPNFTIIGNSSGTFTANSKSKIRLGSTASTINVSLPTLYNKSNFIFSSSSEVIYQSAIQQTIQALNYYNLSSSSSGARILDNTGIIGIAGLFSSGTNTYSINNSTIDFNGSSIQTISAFIFNNLTVSNNIGVSLSGDIGTKDFNNDGLFNTSGKIISIEGNITNDGIFNHDIGTVIISGNSNQQLSGTTSFYNLTINKSAGNFILNNNIDISGGLTLTLGNIVTTKLQLLSLNENASVSGGSSSSYIDGPIAKKMNSTSVFMLPTGKNGNYLPVGITPNSTSNTTFRCEYFDTTSINAPVATTLNKVSQVEYFQVDRIAGSANAYVTLSWNSGSFVNASAMGDLRVARWNGSSWENKGVTTYSGTAISGSITSALVSSFSPFKLASTTSSNPLPIELINFSAEQIENDIKLVWKTASETNNDFFTIERSVDAINFDPIENINGSGNSNQVIQYVSYDKDAPNETIYYRLKQTDYNGNYEYSSVVSINKKLTKSIIYNDTNKQLEIDGDLNEHFSICIYDLDGHLVCLFNPNEMNSAIDISSFDSGIYIVSLFEKNIKLESKKIFVGE